MVLENELGCGLMAAFFPRRNSKPNKTVAPIPIKNSRIQTCDQQNVKPSPKLGEKPFRKSSLRSPTDGTRSSKASTKYSGMNMANHRREATFTSSDLSMTIFTSAPRKSNQNGTLQYRGTTGGHLGNFNMQGNQKGKVLMGNIVRQPGVRSQKTNKLDPDVLKSMGNEEYKQRKFEEALALYNQAIEIDPKNACYYSNKSAALMSLGHLIEASLACREAIKLDPSYHNAHYRLARLYLRLGEAEKAIDHYKESGRKVDKKDTAEAHDLRRLLSKCTVALKMRDYNTLLKETQDAVSMGADSAPQVVAMRAEALMKLQRHEEAYTIIQNGPDFQTELCTRFFGLSRTAYLLIVRAEAYATVGMFENAMTVAQEAAELDPSNEVINTSLRRIKRLASARVKGNELFKENKFSEACSVYTQGLEQVAYNSVLLFNRAACRFKLGQFEKALEDCTAALILRPSYTKARLRRAHTNIKLERWKEAIEDCQVLMQENAEDEEVSRVLLEATKAARGGP